MSKKSNKELKLVVGTGTQLDGTVVKIDSVPRKIIDGVEYISILPHLANENIKPRCMFIAGGYLQDFVFPKVHNTIQVIVNKKRYVGDEISESTKCVKIEQICSDVDMCDLIIKIADLIKLEYQK